MSRRSDIEFVIDAPAHTSTHPVLKAFMVLVILGVLAGAVWFLGFSQWGFQWWGNEARLLTESPEDVVTSYPTVSLTVDPVSLMLEPGESAAIRASVHKTKGSYGVNLADVQVSLTSQNPRVATVDASGRVTAIGVGTATIAINVANADINANPVYCLVTVRQWQGEPSGPIIEPED